jgi:NADH:ubiquinone oxidoreductase subunit F (NADH-binding)
MDRSILEGDPHSVIEGMMIGGYIIGARKGYVYVRAEYPLAVERLDMAIKIARGAGLLGKNILGKGFDFDLEIRIGAGAFVCGEETALMASIEGQRGEPRQKPPFPFQKGLFGKPTIISNVETYANIPPIILKGSEWFSGIGTEKSKGTKVFALAGAINNTGIVEVRWARPWRHHFQYRRRRQEEQGVQGGADRRTVRRLYQKRKSQHPDGLRITDKARRHHGLRRPYHYG